jgi:hypothetical protein
LWDYSKYYSFPFKSGPLRLRFLAALALIGYWGKSTSSVPQEQKCGNAHDIESSTKALPKLKLKQWSPVYYATSKILS